MSNSPEHLDDYDDPFLNTGESLANEIIEKFSIIVSPRKIARQVALRYALYRRELDLHCQVSSFVDPPEYSSFRYSMWASAIGYSQSGNWEPLRQKLEHLGKHFLNGTGNYEEDKEFGISLINLSRLL